MHLCRCIKIGVDVVYARDICTGVRFDHMKNTLVGPGVLLLQCIQRQQVHSSYDLVI